MLADVLEMADWKHTVGQDGTNWWYASADDSPQGQSLQWAADQIRRANSYFYRRQRLYWSFIANGYQYWVDDFDPRIGTSGYPDRINRKRYYYRNTYDEVAEEYDALWNTQLESVTRWMKEHMSDAVSRDDLVLDIECRTGRLRDFDLVSDSTSYLGLEPSSQMLREFRRKHPRFFNSVLATRFSDYWSAARKYDRIVALASAGNRLGVLELYKMLDLLTDTGRWYVMTYFDRARTVEQRQWRVSSVNSHRPDLLMLICEDYDEHGSYRLYWGNREPADTTGGLIYDFAV